MMKPLVLLCPDQKNLPPFSNICRQLIKQRSGSFRFQVIPFREVTRGACDILVGLWWQGTALARANVKPRSVVTCVYDAMSWRVDAPSRQMFRMTLNHTSVLGVANEQIAQDIRSTFPVCPPIYVIEDGVDTDIFKPVPLPKDLRVGWTGNSARHTPGGPLDHKGLDIIRTACSAAGMPLSVLDTAKGGAWSLAEMPEFYREIGVYICASASEGTPNPLLEALACGRPVVTTRVGLAEKLITEGKNGWFIERSTDDLTRILKMIRGLPAEKLREMSIEAAASVQKQSWAKRIRVWDTMLQDAYDHPIADKDTRPSLLGRGAIEKVKPQTDPASWTEEMMVPMVSDPERRVDLERFEISGHALPHSVLTAAIAHAEKLVELQRDRPLIAVPSTWRFLALTMRILGPRVSEFAFYIPPVFRLGDDPAPRPGTAGAMTFYPFADGAWCLRQWNSRGLPYITTLRGRFWDTPECSEPLALNITEGASHVVSLTATLADQMCTRFKKLGALRSKIKVIPHGGYPELRGTSVGEPPGIHSIIPTASRPLIVMSTNMSFKPKADAARELLELVESMESFKGTLALMGQEGPYSPPKGWLGQRTVFLGYVDNPVGVLQGADAFIYVSHQDSLPRSVMEALSVGLPVAVGRSPDSGAHEVIIDGETGLVFDDPQEGIERLLELLTSPGGGKDMGFRGYRSVIDRYSWEHTSAAYGKLLREIMGCTS